MRIEDRRHGRKRLAPTFILLTLAVCAALASVARSGEKPASELPPGSPELMQPWDLVKLSGVNPTVLYVGPQFLYAQAHIPGAEFIGPATDSQSMDRLRKRAAVLPKNARIVLYCGCCPWEHCPNIRPAFKELQKLGFTNAKALYLPKNFGSDWVEKGYPVQKDEWR